WIRSKVTVPHRRPRPRGAASSLAIQLSDGEPHNLVFPPWPAPPYSPPQMARFLSEQDVEGLLTLPLALEAVEQAMAELARGEASNLPRERLRSPETTMHLLQGLVPSHGAVGYKVYTVHQGVARFLLHLYDSRTGQLLGILQA